MTRDSHWNNETATERVLRKTSRTIRIDTIRRLLRYESDSSDRRELQDELEKLETSAREEAAWERTTRRKPTVEDQ